MKVAEMYQRNCDKRMTLLWVIWNSLFTLIGCGYDDVGIKVNGGTFSTRNTESIDLSKRTYIHIYLPTSICGVKIPAIQLMDCPLIDFIETVNEFTKDLRGSSCLMLQIFNKDQTVKITFDDSYNYTRDSLNEVSNRFPQLKTKVTMHVSTFTSLKDVFDRLATLLNHNTDSIKLEIFYYDSLCPSTH